MTREEQIESMADNYYEDHIIKSSDDFIASAQWADKTMLKEVLKWLEETTIDDADGCGHPIVSFTYFESKEEMLQSFKEQFNIE